MSKRRRKVEAAEYARRLRAEINKEVRARAQSAGDYAESWCRAYRALAKRCGYVPPAAARNKLAAVERVGLLEAFYMVVREMR